MGRGVPSLRWLGAGLILILVLVLIGAGVAVFEPARPPRLRRGPRFFVIGVFDQPSYSFGTWKARGVNTVVAYQSLNGTVSFAQWRAALGRYNLYAIRAPEGNPRTDARDPRLLAFLQPDEVDLHPSERHEADDNYARWHSVSRKPVFMNFSGGQVLSSRASAYAPLLKDADWVSNDFYPVAGYDKPGWLDLRQPTGNPLGQVVSKLTTWSKGKPQFQIVEASPQGLHGDAASIDGAQLRGTVWNAVFHGVSGIIYFPVQLSPTFSFDATPPDVAASMTSVDSQLRSLGPVLLAPTLPTAVPSRPFERLRKRYGGKVYTFTLNFSPVAETLDGTRYQPYQMRVESS